MANVTIPILVRFAPNVKYSKIFATIAFAEAKWPCIAVDTSSNTTISMFDSHMRYVGALVVGTDVVGLCDGVLVMGACVGCAVGISVGVCVVGLRVGTWDG